MGRILMPSDPPPTKAKGMVHKLVAETAKEMAGAVYEGLCSASNPFYQRWPSEADFIMRRWHNFIVPAREQLAEMLGMPDSMVSPDQKAEIHEALLLNAAVNPSANLLERPPEPDDAKVS